MSDEQRPARPTMAGSSASVPAMHGTPPQRGAQGESSGTINCGAYARAIVNARARIGNHLDGSLFADPAFDILLDLLASEGEGRKVNMSSCACAARVARTTGLRWICVLERKGLIERICDDADQRTTLVRLTPQARSSLVSYLHQVASVPMLR